MAFRTRSQLIRISIFSVLLVIGGVLAATGMLNQWSTMGPLGAADRGAENAVVSAMSQALVTYALVRGLNGAISVAQETELAVSPAGVGVRLAVGQILDPINDLMERFSWVMLLSTAALGIQQVFMQIGTWLGGGVLLAIALFIWALGLWLHTGRWRHLRRWGMYLTVAALMVRFAMPVTILGAELVYQRFLDADYQKAAASLTVLSDQVSDEMPFDGKDGAVPAAESGAAVSSDESEADPGLIAGIMAYLDGARKQVDLRGRIDRLKRQVGEYADWTIRLIVVFLVRTILMPLVILGAFWMLGRFALGRMLVHPSAETA